MKSHSIKTLKCTADEWFDIDFNFTYFLSAILILKRFLCVNLFKCDMFPITILREVILIYCVCVFFFTFIYDLVQSLTNLKCLMTMLTYSIPRLQQLYSMVS